LNIIGSNQKIKEDIKRAVEKILDSADYKNWSKEMHLNRAIELLKNSNSKTVELISHKNADGFLSLAKIDGYLLKESKFLKEIEKRP